MDFGLVFFSLACSVSAIAIEGFVGYCFISFPFSFMVNIIGKSKSLDGNMRNNCMQSDYNTNTNVYV